MAGRSSALGARRGAGCSGTEWLDVPGRRPEGDVAARSVAASHGAQWPVAGGCAEDPRLQDLGMWGELVVTRPQAAGREGEGERVRGEPLACMACAAWGWWQAVAAKRASAWPCLPGRAPAGLVRARAGAGIGSAWPRWGIPHSARSPYPGGPAAAEQRRPCAGHLLAMRRRTPRLFLPVPGPRANHHGTAGDKRPAPRALRSFSG